MDPVFTEVMKHRFTAIAEEASNIAYRTAYTTFVKQTQDYQVALASLDGEFFAYPIKTGVTSCMCKNVRTVVDRIGLERLKPGDVIISNDPFSSGGLITHTMDIHLIRPVFRDGRPVCFAWSFIHASDIGGAVPGSISPTSSDVFQEGVRIRPQLLYDGGVLNETPWISFADNSRIPDLIWGDLQAMLAALAHLDRRVQELCGRFGTEKFLTGVADVLALSELSARKIIVGMADGEYSFSDYLESFTGGPDIFLHAKMTIAGDELTLDFTGTDPQVPLAINFLTGGKAHHFLCMPIINYIQTQAPAAPKTGGLIRPITTIAPEGTVINATFPAAMGNRFVTVMRIFDVVLGCLNQAIPGGLAAAGAGQAGIIAASSIDEMTGRRHVSVLEPFVGGSGGHRHGDGVDAIDRPISFLRSTPVEVVEAENPLIVREFCLEPGSSGAGMYRSGAAARIAIQNKGLAMRVTVRGLDRFRFQPWGYNGGLCGSTGKAILNPGTNHERDIGKIDVLEMEEDDLLLMVTPAGGGFGDPMQRDPSHVLRDVLDGLLSPEQAKAVYGVIVNDEQIDEDATRQTRLGRDGRATGQFAFGEVRASLERLWPSESREALGRSLGGLPATARTYARDRVWHTLGAAGVRVSPAAAANAAARLDAS